MTQSPWNCLVYEVYGFGLPKEKTQVSLCSITDNLFIWITGLVTGNNNSNEPIFVLPLFLVQVGR